MASITMHPTKNGRNYRVHIRKNSKHLNTSTSRTFDTKREAQQWAKQIELELKNNPPETLEQPPTHHTLKDLITHYRNNDMEGKEPTTQRAQGTILNFWQKHLGNERLDTLTTAKIIKWRDFLIHEKNYKDGTVRQYLALLKAMLNVAVNDLEWIPRSPMAKLTLPPDSPPRERYLTKEEIQRLLEVSKKDSNRSFYPFIYLALHSALRYSEMINIRLGDMDFKNKTITVPKKKNKRQHTIYLSDDVFNVLDVHVTRLVRLQPENWEGMKFEDGKFYHYADAYLFPAEKGDKPAYFIKAWRRARKAAGLENSQVVFHTTRHTVLSALANTGLSDFELAQIANHKDYRSTRRYTKGDPEMIRKNFNRIGALMK